MNIFMNLNLFKLAHPLMGARHLCRFTARTDDALSISNAPAIVTLKRHECRAPGFRFAPQLALTMLLLTTSAMAATPTVTPTNAAPTFAPVPATNALAAIWNDPDFARRLIGSYGFAPDVEPRMAPDELATFRDKVVPLLRDNPKEAQSLLASLAKPGASAVYDFTLGNLYFQNEDLTNAVKFFTSALAKYPDYRRAQKNLGFALVRSARYAEAVAPLTRTISLGGGDSKVFALLGFTYMSLGRNVSAEGAYQQAVVLEPENVDFKLGLVKCAIATANYDHALALLDELTGQFPERDNLWTLQANIYIQKEQPAKAAISLEMLRRRGQATAQNLFLLGDLYMTQESRDLALAAYLEAIEKDGGQNPALALRPAQILVSRSAWDEAKALFAKIHSSSGVLNPADELKLLKLEAKVAMATGAGEEGIATLEQIIGKNPLDGEALLLAGDYYGKHDQKEKAEFRYETAAGIAGFEADAFLKHAQLLVASQKYAPAVELLRKAQKVKPRDNVQRYLEKVEQMSRAGRS
jgi:tetratricopeptide (TPR) repeat protein